MNAPLTLVGPGSGANTGAPPQKSEQAPAAIAFVQDADSAGVVRRCFADLGFADALIETGSLDKAIAEMSQRSWPRFLIVDASGISDPLMQINRLSEICDPQTEVIVIGERNDIVLYRDLRAAGVAEYFYKPLLGSLVARTIAGMQQGTAARPSRSGRLICFLGVRGGVGATTMATGLAWYFAEVRKRGVLLLDLDLQAGDAALQLGVEPSHALREALDDTRRIDELFLERAVVPVTGHLRVLAGLEPLASGRHGDEAAILQLTQTLLSHYRYVVVDLPDELARACPALLHLPSSVILVSDGSLTSLREVARWREFLGPNTPERTVLHVLNKQNAAGALPEAEMLRLVPKPDLSLRWDRGIMSASLLGTKSVQECEPLREALSALSLQLSGGGETGPSLWKRILGRWA